MNKTLFNSSAEVVKFFCKTFEDDYEKIENLLGIEFAYEDGTYRSDYSIDELTEEIEDQELSDTWRDTYRSEIPAFFPTLMVHLFEDGFDRVGNFEICLFEFVQLSDFSA